MIGPPCWSAQALQQASERATELFRKERLEEPLEDYVEAIDKYRGDIEALFQTTVDLAQLDDNALDILTNCSKHFVI